LPVFDGRPDPALLDSRFSSFDPCANSFIFSPGDADSRYGEVCHAGERVSAMCRRAYARQRVGQKM
jgi:hypothetical protein